MDASVAVHGSASPARKLRLGTRAFAWLLAGFLAALATPANLRGQVLWGFNGLVLALFALDALLLSRCHLHVTRALDGRLRQGEPGNVRWSVHNGGKITLHTTLRDEVPDELELRPAQHQLRLKAGQQRECSSEALPARRGRLALGHVMARIQTPLGLASLVMGEAEPLMLQVLPAVTSELRSATRRAELGTVAQRLRRAPQGTEIESLREYVDSDPLRAVDWKATARRHRPVTRLYQPERSQTVWLVLDASRTMASAIGKRDAARQALPKTRFDVAVEAALALADGALRAGDQVGVVVYGDERQKLIAPGRGRAHYLKLLEALSDADAGHVQLRVRGLLAELERHAKKRSLVVLFTDLSNETHGEALCQHAPMLTRRHLSVCVSLQDAHTQARLWEAPKSDDQVYLRAAAMDLLEERDALRKRLEKRGVTVLEADVRGLGQQVLDHYLQVKLQARL